MELLVSSANAAFRILPWLGVLVGVILIVLSGIPQPVLSLPQEKRRVRLRAIGIGLTGLSVAALIMSVV